MEFIRGKHAVGVDPATFARQLAGYSRVLIDLGTGDGRFVRHIASTSPDTFAIGIDLCADNLRKESRRAPANALYIIATAYTPPPELRGVATHLTINFPWSELLEGLLANDTRLLTALAVLCRPGALLEVRLNCGAITAAGWTLEEAGDAVRHSLKLAGFAVTAPRLLDKAELRAFPSTWAHRLAFGRDPRALYLHGIKGDCGYYGQIGPGESTVPCSSFSTISKSIWL
jgi:hypothetical protein